MCISDWSSDVCSADLFADAIVELALASPDTAESETQGRKTTFGKSLVHCLHDAVIHRAAALRMGMQDQGNGCARARRRAETALETAFGPGENDFRHRVCGTCFELLRIRRSEERRVGKECVSRGIFGWVAIH